MQALDAHVAPYLSTSLQTLRRESPAATRVDEDGLRVLCSRTALGVQVRATIAQILVKRLARRAQKRNQALLASLAAHAHKLVIEQKVANPGR